MKARVERVRVKSFAQELKNRRVYRVAIAYGVAASAVVQVAGSVLSSFHAADWMQQVIVVVAVGGFPVALVLAWIFELKGGSIKKTRRSPGSRSAVNNRQVWLLGVMGLLVALFALAGYWLWHPWEIAPAVEARRDTTSSEPSATAAIPEKSIAVLPFENLSDDKQNMHFTAGVQDEILTDLARVADLKVISRSSVMQYTSGGRLNLKEIGRILGVAYVLEGSVQRSGGRVRITAQLIDARTDMHIWAERYDRDIADVFAIETEVAEQIVSHLRAKLSPEEKAAIEEQPTRDLFAYELYIRAKNLMATSVYTRSAENMAEAARLLDEAVARDPKFFLAYCDLASVHDQTYLAEFDHTSARLALADAAIQKALQLRPNSGEVHLALVEHLYCGFLDYDRAREELALARHALPNESRVFELGSYINRRQGHWDDSLRDLKHALELDPRNFYMLQQIAQSYSYWRRYQEEAEALDRALLVSPNDMGARLRRAFIELDWHADTKPLHSTIQALIAADPANTAAVASDWVLLALCERDGAAVRQALAAMNPGEGQEDQTSFSWNRGLVARCLGDREGAIAAFTAARLELEKKVREQPAYAQALSLLGMVEAGLGQPEEAIRTGKHAVELLPVSKDAVQGPFLIEQLALIYAWSGETERACEQLAIVTRMPSILSYGYLRLHPSWDSLRGDPRFEKIVASLGSR